MISNATPSPSLPPAAGRAVEIAGAIEDQSGGGIVPVLAAKAIQQGLSLGIKSKYRPPAITATVVSRAVEIAGAIEDQACLGRGPSVPLPKLCSTCSVQVPPPPSPAGDNLNSVPRR